MDIWGYCPTESKGISRKRKSNGKRGAILKEGGKLSLVIMKLRWLGTLNCLYSRMTVRINMVISQYLKLKGNV